MTRRSLHLAAIALVIGVNTLVLAGVGWNRLGPIDASLVLTERELPLRGRAYPYGEDSGLALSLTVSDSSLSPEWLDDAKLRELGFQLQDPPPNQTELPRQRRQSLPRRGYVVLEFDGPAWQSIVEAQLEELRQLREKQDNGEASAHQVKRAERQLARTRVYQSRLVAVDAGPDPKDLRQRHPDRAKHLVVAAELRLRWVADEYRGDITRFLAQRIHVPRQHQAALGPILEQQQRGDTRLLADPPSPPRYQVAISFGARHEPWITAITAL